MADGEKQLIKEFLISNEFLENSACIACVEHQQRIKCIKVKVRALVAEVRQLEKQRDHLHRLYERSKALWYACMAYNTHHLLVEKFKEYKLAKWQLKSARKARERHELYE